ncbi:MAG: hypothetical protein IV298_15805 [Cylindrospermopsis raciborskii KL1]|nr:hypothetical protein [Cylindrospermopsis raciborskii KL1]
MFLFRIRLAIMALNVLFISSVISPAQAQENPVSVAQGLHTDSSQPGSSENQGLQLLKTSEMSIANNNSEDNNSEKREVDAARLRQQLRVRPIRKVNNQRVYAPGTSAGIPSAFGANWGDLYIAIAGATANELRREIDGGTSIALGFGNGRDILGLELNYNLMSIRKFGKNGSLNAKVHRIVYSSPSTYIATAIGWNNFARHGENDLDAGYYNGQPVGNPSSLYGLVSAYHFLNPKSANPLPINISLGVGEAPLFSNSGLGLIAGAGIQVHPNIGVSTGWSGKGLNLAASYLPVRTLPLSVNVVYGDVLKNTDAGSALSFSIGYGFDFTP